MFSRRTRIDEPSVPPPASTRVAEPPVPPSTSSGATVSQQSIAEPSVTGNQAPQPSNPKQLAAPPNIPQRLLYRARDSIKGARASAKAVAQQRGKSITDLPVEYLGGYNYPHRIRGLLRIYENQVKYQASLEPAASFTIPIEEVVDLAVEGKEDVSRRVTMTRIFFLGIYAWAVKKKDIEKESFITLVLRDGREIVFFVKDRSPADMKRRLATAISHIRAKGKSEAGGQLPHARTMLSQHATPLDDPVESIKKLAELRDMGILTDEEFEAKKTVLLEGI